MATTGKKVIVTSIATIVTSIEAVPFGFLAATATELPADVEKPNILFILLDDVGYGEFGFQGNTQIPTPNIDSLAGNGVRFTQAYVTDSLCCPSRAGILTGRYQARFGHETNPPWGPEWREYGLPLTERTMADRLRELGYATCAIGKWHLGIYPQYWPTERGFDEYYGHLDNQASYFEPEILDTRDENPRPQVIHEEGYYSTFAFGQRARKFIEENRDRPWFVFLSIYALHAPLQAPPGYAEAFPGIADPDRREMAGMMKALDEEVGRVLDRIRELGQEENTLIFLISDNGAPTQNNASINDPLRGTKITHFEGGLRVPFVMQWRAAIPAGVVYEGMVSSLDLLPTMIAAAGGRVDPAWELEGVDLVPYITGKSGAVPRETLYWRRASWRTIRHGDWKLLFRKDHPVQLYNLKNDIREKSNLAAQFPERVQDLRLRWEQWNERNVEPLWHSHPYD